MTYKIALPFSGGFDSLVSYLVLTKEQDYNKDDIFVYNVRYGSPYQRWEDEAIEKLSKKFGFNVKQYDLNLVDHDVPIEDPTIPARNFMIAYLGAYNANTVVIGAPLGEYTYFRTGLTKVADKNPKAFKIMGDALSFTMEKDVKVISIIEDKTKSEWTTWLDKFGLQDYVIQNTVSCHGKINPCGRCQPCFWKWLTMINNDLDPNTFFNDVDWTSETVATAIKNLQHFTKLEKDAPHYNHWEARYHETFKALDKVGIEYGN